MSRQKSFFSLRWNRFALALGLGGIVLALGFHPSDASTVGSGIRVSSGVQTYALSEGRSSFDENVKVAMQGTEVVGPHADFKMDDNGQPSMATFTQRPKMVRSASGGLKQTIQADTLNMEIKSGALQAKGRVVTQMSGDEAMGNVAIQSDTQIFDQEKGLMRAVGHVSVKKGDTVATSPEAIIFLSDAGGAEKVVFIKGARLVQGGQEMRAETITIKIDSGDIYAEKNTQSTIAGKDSKGNPTTIKILSHLQEMDKATGTLLANGNAVVNYDDYVAKGPKAVFYRQSDTLDRIVMTGRAQIEDSERKVVGDTVIITIDPKQFNAQGNVTTFIKAKKKQVAASSTPVGATTSPADTKAGSTKPAAAASPTKAWDEEQMIEEMTQGSEKQP